jgi:hypothetical protein
VPFIDARVLPGEHARWFFRTVLPGATLPLGILWTASLLQLPSNRALLALVLSVICASAISISICASSHFRTIVREHVSDLIASINKIRIST